MDSNTLDDGNPRAPIIRAQRPFECVWDECSPTWRTLREQNGYDPMTGPRTGNFATANEARRSIHAGTLSHDDEGMTA